MFRIFQCLLFSTLFSVCVSAQNIDTAQLFKEDSSAVVLIVSQKSGAPVSQGTGVLVSKDGTILSALHVVEGADSAVVKLKNGDVYDAVSVIAFDARRDLVVLKVSGFDLPTLPLGNSNEAKEGDPVALISNPKGLEGSITQGIISAIRDIGDMGFKVIQTTASASPGSSGGAILNASGELIGILSFKVVGGENLNFGIPVNYARGMLDNRETFPLAQLESRVAGMPVRSASQLQGANPTDMSGEWKSLTSGKRFKVRLEGQHAYVEWLPTEEQTKLGYFQLCDLKAEGTKYGGTCKTQSLARWWDRWHYQWRTRACQFNFQMELTRYSTSRIEGRTEAKGLGKKWSTKDYSNCGERFPVEWTDFVWIRPE
ncbi:MAG: S1C family serine protease [Terriglobia bacterium]